MIDLVMGVGFSAWLALTAAVTVGVLSAALVIQLTQAVLSQLEETWQQLVRWWQR